MHLHEKKFTCISSPNPKPQLTLSPVTTTSLAEHVLLTARAANQFEEEPEIVADEDENRKIAAEALKKLDKVKHFIEVNGSYHLNMIFNESIEKAEQMKLKSNKQSDIRSFFRS